MCSERAPTVSQSLRSGDLRMQYGKRCVTERSSQAAVRDTEARKTGAEQYSSPEDRS